MTFGRRLAVDRPDGRESYRVRLAVTRAQPQASVVPSLETQGTRKMSDGQRRAIVVGQPKR